MLEFLDTPSPDVPSPPRSLWSQNTHHSRPIGPGITRASTHNSQRITPLGANSPCHCLQTYADLLCALRQAEGVERFGSFVQVIDDAYSTLRENLKCSQCIHDNQVMQLCSMVLKTLVNSIRAACATPHTPSISSGDYAFQQEDSDWIFLLLLGRKISRSRCALDIFKRRLDRSKIAGNCSPQEQEYLDQVVESIDESMSLTLNHIQGTLRKKK